MPKVLVSGAVIQCKHKGQAKIVGGDPRLTVSGQGAITLGMETGISFKAGSPTVVVPCPFPNPSTGAPSPCTATLPATSGQATLLSIGGVPVILDTASGTAINLGDPSGSTWSVASAGQTLLTAS